MPETIIVNVIMTRVICICFIIIILEILRTETEDILYATVEQLELPQIGKNSVYIDYKLSQSIV